MPSGRGTGRFPPALPAGQGGEKAGKSLFPPHYEDTARKMLATPRAQHGLTTKASCHCTVEFCICHRARASVASRPATVLFLCRGTAW